jgi:hypothetical protein
MIIFLLIAAVAFGIKFAAEDRPGFDEHAPLN